MSAIAEGTVGRGRPGDCSNRGHGHVTVLQQPPALSPQAGGPPAAAGCTHRPGADAAGVRAAVPVPPVGTPVYGVADVAVAAVPGAAGAGDVHPGLGALRVPGAAPVVLAAHVDHCREKGVR